MHTEISNVTFGQKRKTDYWAMTATADAYSLQTSHMKEKQNAVSLFNHLTVRLVCNC